jgi:hypothetical protein
MNLGYSPITEEEALKILNLEGKEYTPELIMEVKNLKLIIK